MSPELGGALPESLGDTLAGDGIPAGSGPPSQNGCDLSHPLGFRPPSALLLGLEYLPLAGSEPLLRSPGS